ncbi:surface lipoprotein assembly modifier, partial [Rickettsiales bacterium]|nr:surface lipoprotein assembly modifier [Rickettsiales bacterium]
KMERFKEAKTLFEEVLIKDPPKSVRKNIIKMLAVVNGSLKKHKFTGSITTGYNHDTNANSAANSGTIIVNDVPLQLSSGSTTKKDGHAFIATTIGHSYKFDDLDDNTGLSLDSSATFYRTQQGRLNNLDLSLLGIKTGPVINFKKQKTKVGFTGAVNWIQLDSSDYLRTKSWELSANKQVSKRFSMGASLTSEQRQFYDSASIKTYAARTGNAWQYKFTGSYLLSPKSMFNAEVITRNEDARSKYHGLSSTQINANYLRQMPYDVIANILLSLKKSYYDAADPLVSNTIFRHDHEKSSTITLAKKLPYNVTASIGYQYKNNDSNVINYDYTNHRLSTTVGWSF